MKKLMMVVLVVMMMSVSNAEGKSVSVSSVCESGLRGVQVLMDGRGMQEYSATGQEEAAKIVKKLTDDVIAARREETVQMMSTMMRWMVIGLLLFMAVAASILMYILIRRRMRRDNDLKRRKDALKMRFQIQKKEFDRIMGAMVLDVKELPDWAITRYQTILGKIGNNIKRSAEQALQEFPKSIKSDPAKADEWVTLLEGSIAPLQEALEQTKRISSEIMMYKSEAKEYLDQMDERLKSLRKMILAAQEFGFWLTEYETMTWKFGKDLAALRTRLDAKRKEERQVYEESVRKMAEIRATMHELAGYIKISQDVQKAIERVEDGIKLLPEKQEAARYILDELKSLYSKSNWQDIESRLLSIPELLQRCEDQKSRASRENSMEIQKFREARISAETMEQEWNLILDYCQAVYQRKAKIISAKDQYAALAADAECKLSDAKAKIVQAKADQRISNAYGYAQRRFDEIRRLVQSSQPDWLLIELSLKDVMRIAQDAYKDAVQIMESRQQVKEAAEKAATVLTVKNDDEAS